VDFHRRSIRLKGWDYSNNGYYFVTICAKDRENIFGEIVGARLDSPKIRLNNRGIIVNDVWRDLPNHINNIVLDEFIVMPNHIHFILIIKNNNKGESSLAPTLGWIIGMFKSEISKRINKIEGLPRTIWFQRNYFERIIRTEEEYFSKRIYIRNNVINWNEDELAL
jgi:REP element-mobilizing transposase RayT